MKREVFPPIRVIPAALLSLLFLAPAALCAESTFLESWLAGEHVNNLGRQTWRQKTTGKEMIFAWVSSTPDRAVKAYKNTRTGETMLCRGSAQVGDKVMLQRLEGGVVSVSPADYMVLGAYEAVSLDGETLFLVMEEYEKTVQETLGKNAFVFVPVYGEIAFGSVARNFETGIAEVCRLRPAGIVVLVDSKGGRIDLAERMCAAIQKARREGVKCFAYVNGKEKGACSAGAMVSLACDGVVMSPGSVMGAASPVAADQKGALTNVTGDPGAKMVSELCAKFRALAEGSGFPPALAAAMVDKALGVVEVTQGDARYLVSNKDVGDLTKKLHSMAWAPPTQKTICGVGSLLTISAEEASRLGAIKGIAEKPDALRKLLGAEATEFAVYDPVDKFHLRMKPIEARIADMENRLLKEVSLVRATSPANFTYEVRPGGLFTDQGARDWRMRIDECLKHVTGCIAIFNEVLAAMKKQSEFFDDEDASYVERQKQSCVELQTKLQAQRNLKGLVHGKAP